MDKLKLTDREWGEFFIGGKDGIFSIKATKSGIDKNKLNTEIGNIPYITRTDMDNGINLFITDAQNSKYTQDNGNVITIGLDTQTVFYQQNSFYTGQNIQVLTCDKLNKQVAMFIIPLLKIQMKKFSWGSNGATLGRLNRTKIKLPINKQNEPDWQFMEDYIKQIEQEKIKQLIGYYQTKLLDNQLKNDIGGGKVYKIQWDIFKISDFFDFMRGNQNNMAKCKKGDIPLISARKVDNGYKDFIADNGKKLFPAHIITLNNDGDGGVGLAYYQSTQTALDTHVTALLPKINLAKNVMLYICLTISIQRDKFSHGYSINNERLSAQKIMLPIDDKGNPNWQFMEDYIKQIEKDKIETLLSYLNQYNALVESRESRVESRESRVESRESRVESRESRVESRESRVESRESRVESRESRVESRESRVESRESRVESRESRVESRESRVESRESRVENSMGEI
ncbi:restriction endonuclease subunit S [Moraxella sp. ZY21109]|uniref:restriction endonuclease subunit S n=1 Tax=Moraxella sp. ZY21109 TaxID=2911969 RepID=UPI003D7DE2C5